MKIDLKQYQAKTKDTSQKKPDGSLMDVLNKDIAIFPSKLSDKKKEQFYSELSILFSAGADIRSALELIEQEQEKEKDKKLFFEIKESVIAGGSLSEALQKTNKFSLYEYYSIKIGEESGGLTKVLKNLSDYYSKKIKQRRQISSAISYPAVVLTASLGALFFMIKFVVPVFADIFKQLNRELPFLTKMIIRISDAVSNYSLFFLIVIAGLVALAFTQRKNTWYRKTSSFVVLKIPVVGELVKKIYLARFCNSMSMLAGAKTPLVNSIDLVSKMVGFYPIESSLDQIKNEIVKGNSLHQSMEKYSIYNKRMVYLIKVAEEVNQVDSIFQKLSDQYADEVEHQTKVFLSLLEPLMIILLGLIVGTIFISMYLPLFQMSTSVG